MGNKIDDILMAITKGISSKFDEINIEDSTVEELKCKIYSLMREAEDRLPEELKGEYEFVIGFLEESRKIKFGWVYKHKNS